MCVSGFGLGFGLQLIASLSWRPCRDSTPQHSDARHTALQRRVRLNAVSAVLRARRWLEQFDWIAVRIFDLYLPAARTDLHLVAKRDAGVSERGDARG